MGLSGRTGESPCKGKFLRCLCGGVDATRLASDLDRDGALQALLEEIRCRGAVLFGLAESMEQARDRVKAVPKIALVAPPAPYQSSE